MLIPFQSTHPLRGATPAAHSVLLIFSISIHAPLAGCDCGTYAPACAMDEFQSTHPLRGATLSAWRIIRSLHLISIHAPLAGCDDGDRRRAVEHLNFNPRTPCGVRRCSTLPCARWSRFQSTHPLRGATTLAMFILDEANISIHAPLAGCDYSSRSTHWPSYNFNPRTPCGVRHWNFAKPAIKSRFQSTHPLRGATLLSCPVCYGVGDFNPRTPCGVRQRQD